MRESTGMNRKEFAEYFGIPYPTITDWELGHRKMPGYLLRLIAYKVEMEKLIKK
ncbi:MAG: helix-turn-helix domain-containing protein [Lachnospiraceae bacterium]|nr:helix-turn-helix domain-containing protein [Lachnospiraceae bacterium]